MNHNELNTEICTNNFCKQNTVDFMMEMDYIMENEINNMFIMDDKYMEKNIRDIFSGHIALINKYMKYKSDLFYFTVQQIDQN